MKFAAGLPILAACSLAACSPGTAEDMADENVSEAGTELPAEETAFLTEYRASFMDSCVASATSTGAPEAFAQSTCECSLDVLIRDLDQSELISPSQQQMAGAVQECTQG